MINKGNTEGPKSHCILNLGIPQGCHLTIANELIKPNASSSTKDEKISLTGNSEKWESIIRDEKQVIIHCHYHNFESIGKIRVWKTTFLHSRNTNHQSTLVSAYNISMYPEWMTIEPFKIHKFTLIFTGLPDDCSSFDLWEKIPEPGGFIIKNIKRNEKDIYHLIIR